MEVCVVVSPSIVQVYKNYFYDNSAREFSAEYNKLEQIDPYIYLQNHNKLSIFFVT